MNKGIGSKGKLRFNCQRAEAGLDMALPFYCILRVAIVGAPSDEVATTFALALGSLGNVRMTPLRAYTKEEFPAIVKKLP